MLDNKDWARFDNAEDDPNTLWEIFINNLTLVLDEMCPIKQLTVPEHKPKWINNEILLLMRKRDKTYREARAKNDPIIWRKARFLRNRVELMIKNRKKEKIQGELNKNRTSPKKFWNSIKEIWPKGDTTAVHSLRRDNDSKLFQGNELAGHINEYFANIGASLADDIRNKNTKTSTSLLYYNVLNNHHDSILVTPVTQDEVLRIINDVDINKSSSIDNVRSVVLIDAFKSQLERMTRLYNGSLTRCIFPTRWKEGTIIPLPKISNPRTASDMRPIALLPIPGKILERIISNRLKFYLSDHNILTQKQHGFRKGRSTLSAIVEFLNNIYENINDNHDSYIVYLNLKKAFDTVCHELLLKKLKNIGLRSETVAWFGSYLTDRVQKTKINENCSTYLPVPYGVPQGSILGPTLFSIYINDLVHFVNCDLVFYADDTVILDKDPLHLCRDLVTIYNWCNQNFLTINCKKSQWMRTTIIEKNVPATAIFSIGGVQMAKVDEYKYLGVYIDTQLNFQSHRQKMINSVNYKLTFFKKIRNYVTLDAAKTIYKGTILPMIEYADFVFDFGIKYINKTLQTLQNQGLFIVFNQHYLPYNQKQSIETLHRLRRANVFRLAHRRKVHMLSFIFNYTNQVDRLDVRNLPTRRHDGLFFKEQQIVHHKAKQNPLYRAMLSWNDLPGLVRNCEKKEPFKKKLVQRIVNPYKKVYH